MGTGVMIGAESSRSPVKLPSRRRTISARLSTAGIVAGFSAYSYVKMAEQYPSAGGIAMFLMKAYGKGPSPAPCPC
ncbi:MAG: hypothetical protein R3C56_33460 [Pirellulaceae bacterium]